jgi:hypothetical protein
MSSKIFKHITVLSYRRHIYFISTASVAFALRFQRVGRRPDFINKSVKASALQNCYPQSLRTVPNIICVTTYSLPQYISDNEIWHTSTEGRTVEYLTENPIPVPLYSPKNPHAISPPLNLVFLVRNRCTTL